MLSRRRFPNALLPALALVSLTGCDSEVVLAGNFDQWPTPVITGSLPGDPSGDTVSQYVYDGNAAAQVFNDRLFFSDALCPVGQACGLTPWVYFSSAELDAAQQVNPFVWGIGGEAFLQPDSEMRITFYDGHFSDVAELRFERDAGEETTVTFVHGGGEVEVETLDFGDTFGYGVSTNPGDGSVSLIGYPAATDVPAINPALASARGFFIRYNNSEATLSGVIFDTIEAYAQN